MADIKFGDLTIITTFNSADWLRIARDILSRCSFKKSISGYFSLTIEENLPNHLIKITVTCATYAVTKALRNYFAVSLSGMLSLPFTTP